MKISRRDLIKASAAAAAVTMAGLPIKMVLADSITYGRTQCRYCGVGCTVMAGVKDGKMVAVKGDSDSPINFGRICMKGYNLHYILYGEKRLTKPLVRQADGSYRTVSWDYALDYIADTFAGLIQKHGVDSVAWYGSGQCTTQESFAANKLFKGIIGTANVEGNPRLCMASAVGGYLNTFGSDEPPGTYDDFEDCDCFFLVGSNAAEAHPILFKRIIDRKSSHPERVKIIAADPRSNPTTRYADLHLKFKPGFDMYLLNAMAQVIIEEGMVDEDHLKHCAFRFGLKTKGKDTDFAGYKKFLTDYTPEKVADKVEISAADIRATARIFGRKGHSAMTIWTMGINERTLGVEMNCQLSNLNLLTGKIGRPGSDAFSLTGQPNACGGVREQGGLTHLLPGHRVIANAKHRAEIAEIWGVPVEGMPKKPSAHAIKMFDNLVDKKIKAIWVNTTSPGQSLPNINKYRPGMQEAFTVVSDVYPTRTTELASVILPSSMWIEKEGIMGQTDRRSQFLPKLVEARAGTKTDFWQVQEVAKRIAKRLNKKTSYRVIDPETGRVKSVKSVYGLGFETEKEAWDEYRLCTRGQKVDLWGATYEKLKAHSGGVQWPCPSTDFDNRGSSKRYISKDHAMKYFGVLKKKYKTGFVTTYDQYLEDKGLPGPFNYYGGTHPFLKTTDKAIIRVLKAELDYEMPDKEYPYVLNTGRVIEHWHTGSMTMLVPMLRQMNPSAYVEVTPDDARKLKVQNGDNLKLTTRRGELVLPVWVTGRARTGMVFVPWFDPDRMINKLTISVLPSLSKAFEPNYKVCAVKLEKV